MREKHKRQIARDMKISRTTVAKYIKNYEASKSKLSECDDIKLKEDRISPPKYNSAARTKVKLTDEIIEEIGNHLKENEIKRATGRSKQQKKKIDILEALRDEGYDIGYTTVCTAVSDIKKRQKEAFIRQLDSWGDSSEFDWGYVKILIAKKPKTVHMGAFTTAKATGDTQIDRLILLFMFHDIGKVNIPKEVLTKKGKVTPRQWDVIKQHPQTDYRIALAIPEFSHLVEDILCHHDRWDGSGYPRGLKEKNIPLLARILAIADAYEIMINGRIYKKALSKDQAIEELRHCAGSQFDPELVEEFISSIF